MREIQISQQLSHSATVNACSLFVVSHDYINGRVGVLVGIFVFAFKFYTPTMLPVLISFITKQ